ncbi:MAG TPA: hypothetical protein VMH87_12250, partial [Pseudomonadales bacterium]|nr:hypothetical protein [Pseudomonadales bacterium]
IDYSDKIELLGRRMFGHLWKKRRLPWEDEDFNKDEKELERMEAERRAAEGEEADVGGQRPEKKEGGSQKAEAGKSDHWTDGTDEVEGRPLTPTLSPDGGEGSGVATQASPSLTSEQTQKDTVGPRCGAAAADQQVSPTTASASQPSNPYAGKSTQELMAEAEENHAREKADRLNQKRQKEGHEEAAATQRGPTMTHVDRGMQKELSAYDQALLEGKTHVEAMYALASPVEKPNAKESLYFKPNPLDGVSEPPRVSGYECRHEPMRPPPGFNSLG